MNWLVSVYLLVHLGAFYALVQGTKNNYGLNDAYLKYGSETEGRFYGIFDNPRLIKLGAFYSIKVDYPANNYVALFKIIDFDTMIMNRVRIATMDSQQYVSMTFIDIKDARSLYASTSINSDAIDPVDSYPLDKVIIMHQDHLIHKIMSNMALDIRTVVDENGDNANQFVIYPTAFGVRVPSLIFKAGEFSIWDRNLANRVVLSTTIGYSVFYIGLVFFERHIVELFHNAIENYDAMELTIPDEVIPPLLIANIIDSKTTGFGINNYPKYVCGLNAAYVKNDPTKEGRLFTIIDNPRLIENANNYTVIVDMPETQHTAASFKLRNFDTMITNRVQIVTDDSTQIVSMTFINIKDAWELYNTIQLPTVNIVSDFPLSNVVIMNSTLKAEEILSDVALDIETVADENNNAVDQFVVYSTDPAIRRPFIIFTVRELNLRATNSIDRVVLTIKVGYSIFYLGLVFLNKYVLERFYEIIKSYKRIRLIIPDDTVVS